MDEGIKYDNSNMNTISVEDADKCKVSIVLPVYNGEKYLAEAIEGVIKQTYENWELIIVDDCSTDNSNEIAKSYSEKDSRIRVIKNKINSKTPKTLNNGFAIAKGEYFTWTSDDNIYHPEAIERMAGYLDEHPSIGLVNADMETMDERGKKSLCRLVEPKRETLLYQDIIGACFMYRREMHETLNGYDDNWYLIEDYDFWLRSSRTYDFGHIPEVLYTFRKHKGAQSFTRRRDVAELTVKLLEREQEYGGCFSDEYMLKRSCAVYGHINYCRAIYKKYVEELKMVFPERYKQESIGFKSKEYMPIPLYYLIKKCFKKDNGL